MSKKIEQSLWVTSVSPRPIFGERYVATAINYPESGNPIIGSSAFSSEGAVVNENFKVDLGDVVPGGSTGNRKKFKTNIGDKSAYELTKDYFDTLLSVLEEEYPRSEETNYKNPAKIIVAEPLAFQVPGHSKQWIDNYRSNIRRILDRYEKVEFLPEPFAVYQYYRYGLRLPALQDKAKQIALILDFGGGTFDACIIESTHAGDISQSGKTSKPLSADSIPVGGFYINRQLAKYLIKRHLDNPGKKLADNYYSKYERVLRGDLEVEDLKEECQVFIGKFIDLEKKCEQYKLNLVSQLSDSDWGLEADAYQKVLVSVPENPFIPGPWSDVEFFAHNLRDLFVREIWDNNIKRIVTNVIGRAKESLKDKSITITLISGGSSNFRWLQALLNRDFSSDIYGAEPVPINHSFQEVVANGLAIECARRFYDSESEFVAVTYNPIKLYLNPDESGLEKGKRYKSVGEKIDMSRASPGDLIPSAQSLKHFFGEELQWRIKLKKAPKRYLEYYFTRPEAEENYYDSYNVEETRISTRDPKHFDQQLIISLKVDEDGTARPKFIYKSKNESHGVKENSESGRPFYIDMTADSVSGRPPSRFVGFDFGTSNSSVCLLSQSQIKLTQRRQAESGWRGLSQSVSSIPYPVAVVVRKFLCDSSPGNLAESAREAFEAALAFMAYTAASEASALGKPVSLKGFQHRSMGPLKDLLTRALKEVGKEAVFSAKFQKMLERDNALMNKAIDDFNEHKHHKLAESDADWQSYVEFAVKVLVEMMNDFVFGYCSTSVPEGFGDSFTGKFIVAHDQPRFLESFNYSSDKAIPPAVALIQKKNTAQALSLTPFLFWRSAQGEMVNHNCYWIDKSEKDAVIVKPCNEPVGIKASEVDPDIDSAAKKLYQSGETVYGAISLSQKKAEGTDD